jgi:hypothetical protein
MWVTDILHILETYTESLKSYLREAGYEEWLQEGTCRLENIEEAIDMIAEDYFKDELNRD